MNYNNLGRKPIVGIRSVKISTIVLAIALAGSVFIGSCEKKIIKPKPPIDNKTLKDKKVMQARGV
ncbi:hypothetical protein [Pedobacter sp. Leaf132]|uniref:hypothetical protein n=1 Tax=Pedobacter sp. Leaf132 TaxID=2876557 RepID=UPI001E5B41A5|nr:hypothetical protein [Pedobacter sp. Leaf132]